VRIDRERIMPVGAAHAFALRNRIVPLFDLAELVGIAQSPPASAEAIVVVAVVGGDLAGMQVDRLGERMDVMLNPMDGLLQGTPGIAGTTLLGDGRVLIVLDLAELLG
jgi:two-component system, chemotaxis family, sensor kinase CheA